VLCRVMELRLQGVDGGKLMLGGFLEGKHGCVLLHHLHFDNPTNNYKGSFGKIRNLTLFDQ
jgi:hypothetical protein